MIIQFRYIEGYTSSRNLGLTAKFDLNIIPYNKYPVVVFCAYLLKLFKNNCLLGFDKIRNYLLENFYLYI